MKIVYYNLAGSKITEHDCKIISCVIQGLKRAYICIVLKNNSNSLNTEMRILFAKLRVHDKLELYKLATHNGFSEDGTYSNLPLWKDEKEIPTQKKKRAVRKKSRQNKPKDKPNQLF